MRTEYFSPQEFVESRAIARDEVLSFSGEANVSILQ